MSDLSRQTFFFLHKKEAQEVSGGSVIPTSRLLSRKEKLECVHTCAGGGGWGWKEDSGVWEPVGKCGDLGVSCWVETRGQGGHTGC